MKSREQIVPKLQPEKDPKKGLESASRRLFLSKAPALAILGAGLLAPNDIDEKDVPRISKAPRTQSTLETPSDKEDLESLESFYKAHMSSVIDKLIKAEYDTIPWINELFYTSVNRIHKNFNAYPRIHYIHKYAEVGKKALAINYIKNGQPLIFYITPAFRDFYDLAKSDKVQNIDELFESTLVITTMHELDHLALGHSASLLYTPESFDRLEAAAWAKTCEDTIRLFVEKGLPVSESNQMYYKAWEDAGKSATSQKWRDEITRIHADVKR